MGRTAAVLAHWHVALSLQFLHAHTSSHIPTTLLHLKKQRRRRLSLRWWMCSLLQRTVTEAALSHHLAPPHTSSHSSTLPLTLTSLVEQVPLLDEPCWSWVSMHTIGGAGPTCKSSLDDCCRRWASMLCCARLSFHLYCAATVGVAVVMVVAVVCVSPANSQTVQQYPLARRFSWAWSAVSFRCMHQWASTPQAVCQVSVDYP